MCAVEVSANPLLELHKYGQSPWMDNFRRGWILSGDLERMIREDGITGVTVNPTIFEHAISASTDYDDDIRRFAAQGKDTEAVYEELMVHDICMAADLFRPVYDAADGTDGFVSIELPPALAYDTVGSIREAHRFRDAIGRDNIMIKVPGTAEGIPVIEELTYDGINVNVTLLFSIENYEEVARAYVRGLERRQDDGEPVNGIASVASFFVSRIDTAVDKEIEALIAKADSPHKRAELESLLGKAATANAKLAYRKFKEIFCEPRFKELEERGARTQKVLWASTGTKNPKYSDVYYIESLIGFDTVNTIPTQTIFAFRDHGKARSTIEEDVERAEEALRRIREVGIDFDAVTKKLQDDGVKLFQKSVDEMMSCLRAKISAVNGATDGRQVLSLGEYQTGILHTVLELGKVAFSRRLWEKDPTLWRQGADGALVVKNRLGWLNLAETMTEHVDEIEQLTEQVRDSGFAHAVLLGMGGSSLSPEVSRVAFGVKKGYPSLMVLDTTVPGAIIHALRGIDPAKTLFIVSSKTGSTVETMSGYEYFYDKVKSLRGNRAGESFIAITDSGTPLEVMARKKRFRHVFVNPSDIGGRYSALSYFGLVPAAIIGVDIRELLQRASCMTEACVSCVTPAENAGVVLGTVLGELALAGTNKVTLITSPEIRDFGLWVEQLLAESTGKNGAGLIPVTGEPLAGPRHYGSDRVFVYLRLETSDNRQNDGKMDALRSAGYPSVRIRLDDLHDLGREYFRWQVATATAGALLGVNPFDEPNVRESKENTNRLLDGYKASRTLPKEHSVAEDDGVQVFCDPDYASGLDKIRSASPHLDNSVVSYVSAHLGQFQPGNYIALLAFVAPSSQVDASFQRMREQLRDAYKAATTFGYGPRFLHSTGQLHKGGPNSGIFIQFTADDAQDVPIPGAAYTFGVLKQAQVMGDAISLRAKGRPLIRLHLGGDVHAGLNRALSLVHDAIERNRS